MARPRRSWQRRGGHRSGRGSSERRDHGGLWRQTGICYARGSRSARGATRQVSISAVSRMLKDGGGERGGVELRNVQWGPCRCYPFSCRFPPWPDRIRGNKHKLLSKGACKSRIVQSRAPSRVQSRAPEKTQTTTTTATEAVSRGDQETETKPGRTRRRDQHKQTSSKDAVAGNLERSCSREAVEKLVRRGPAKDRNEPHHVSRPGAHTLQPRSVRRPARLSPRLAPCGECACCLLLGC